MLKRRDFMATVGACLVAGSLPTIGSSSESIETDETIERRGWRLRIAGSGEIVSLKNGTLELVNQNLGDNRPTLLVLGKRIVPCEHPVQARREGFKVTFKYEVEAPLPTSVDYEIELMDLENNSVAVRQYVDLKSSGTITDRLMLLLPRNIHLPWENRKVFLPLKNGIGRHKAVAGLVNDDEYVFRLAGDYIGGRPQMLAIPFVDEYSEEADLHITFGADPFFTSYFFLPYRNQIGQFHCIFPGGDGFQPVPRTVYTGLHRGDQRTAMGVFYRTSLADVKPGPDWIHEIAMQNYDYHSENGRGWFADIDKLEEVIRPPDRQKVLLATMWFDYMGRYAFNYRTRSLERTWTAFPRVLEPDVQALGNTPEMPKEIRDPSEAMRWRKKSLDKVRPYEMSIGEMHRRLRYAKDRGFRVALYFADGTAAGSGLTEVFDPTKVLRWQGWEGPDTIGRTYQQNPLHPQVRDFYKSYMQALLAEYGQEVDGFAWDETFYIDPGDVGSAACPGYADRAMMTLVHEVASLVQNYSPQLALFASDNIGFKTWTFKAPYALVAHGTYQDSHCRPEAWPYGLFPNYRNTIWSCNWAPVTNFLLTEYAVDTFDAPVAISNGPFGDDTGVSEMTPQQLKQILGLFERRKQSRMEIGWIEEREHNLTYRGRRIKYECSV